MPGVAAAAGGEQGPDLAAMKEEIASVMQGVMDAIGDVAVGCVSTGEGPRQRGGPSRVGPSHVKLTSQWRVRGTRAHPFRLHDGTWVIPALLRR
jgi:hypothetical protein